MANNPIRIPDFSQKVEVPGAQKQESIPKKIIFVKKPDYVFRGAVFGILSIFILGGVYFVYNYALNFLETKERAQEQRFVFENPLVRGDRSRVISLEAGANKETVRSILVQALKNERVPKGEISIITPSYLRDTVIDNERKLISEPQRGDDFFFTFAVRSPLNLRTLAAEKYALGTAGVSVNQEVGSNNFFMFSVNSAPDAVREMLRYENQIYYDMQEVLKLRDIVGEYKFRDLSDNNQLMRVGEDDNGVVLVYGFPTPRTVLVAPNTETYQFIISRLK
jgi:hypothetical protein